MKLAFEFGKQFHCSYSGVDEQISREITDLSTEILLNGSPVTFQSNKSAPLDPRIFILEILIFACHFSDLPLKWSTFSDYFPINRLVVWKTVAGLQMCLKQALRDSKQLLWWSLTKDFHENDKLEVKLR